MMESREGTVERLTELEDARMRYDDVLLNDLDDPDDETFDRLQAAILASDPRVQALEAVARAAQGVGGGAECEQRGAEFKQPSWCATHPQEMWPCPYTELTAALAALQGETGEDGASRNEDDRG